MQHANFLSVRDEADKSAAKSQKYIDLCISADKLKWRADEKRADTPAACWLTDDRPYVYASGTRIVIW